MFFSTEEFLTLKKQQLAQLYEKMSNFDNIVKIIQNQITETADEQVRSFLKLLKYFV